VKLDIAVKLRVGQIIALPLITEDRAVFLKKGEDLISRVNVIGTVIEASDRSLIIDDGTGQVLVQWYDKTVEQQVGDLVLVVGRMREFNQRYISPYFIKKITNPLWVTLRNKELTTFSTPEITSPAAASIPVEETRVKVDDALKVITECDQGQGADFDVVVEKLGPQGEEVVKKLLMAGEIFESTPGKLRIL
jgi:hypothetical protein